MAENGLNEGVRLDERSGFSLDKLKIIKFLVSKNKSLIPSLSLTEEKSFFSPAQKKRLMLTLNHITCCVKALPAKQCLQQSQTLK